ncbi:MAG: hypothetical protein JWO38_1850 [Gemmataceae bacterium]|nr:hypothetical protein [Gemmataceae bacterium]
MGPTTDRLSLANRLETTLPPVIVAVPAAAPLRVWWTSTTVLVALVLLGIGVRSVALARDRNLWIDEAMLALNLVDRAPAQLLEPLDWNQGAPVGFLLLVKGAITQFGASEVGLRLVPFVSSLLGLAAFALLAVKLLPRPAAVLAVALTAVSPYLMSYAAECKQYASDAATTAGLFALSAGLLRGETGTRRWVGLGIGGAAAVWFSHPAVFVLGGIGTAILLEAGLKKDRARLLAAGGTVGFWLLSFAACYFLFLRQLGGNQYLLDYWDGHFLPLPPKSPGDLAWLADHYFSPFGYPGGLGGTEIRAGGIAGVLFVVGVWGMWKERWVVAAAVVLPAAFALLASGLHKYPFAGRLLLFLVPLMMLGVARGAWAVGAALRGTQPLAAAAFLVVLGAAPCLEAYQELRKPLRYEQVDPMLAQVRENWKPGDRMYVYYGAVPAFKFYTRDNPFPADAVVLGTEARAKRAEYQAQLTQLKGSPRVWLVFSHRHRGEEAVIRAYAEGMGRCEKVVTAPGAAACLFDFTAAPGSAVSGDTSPTTDRTAGSAGITRGGDR